MTTLSVAYQIDCAHAFLRCARACSFVKLVWWMASISQTTLEITLIHVETDLIVWTLNFKMLILSLLLVQTFPWLWWRIRLSNFRTLPIKWNSWTCLCYLTIDNRFNFLWRMKSFQEYRDHIETTTPQMLLHDVGNGFFIKFFQGFLDFFNCLNWHLAILCDFFFRHGSNLSLGFYVIFDFFPFVRLHEDQLYVWAV